ncbi:MAG: hypothetical protein ACFFDL_05505 [Promethearchaeota archaeon]
MKKLEEIGICPKCKCSLTMYKTSNYKRFVKCEICKISYPLPKKGKISNSALNCPRNNFPILIIERPHQSAYFWTDKPCFSCIDYDRCVIIHGLKSEFKELEVYGY